MSLTTSTRVGPYEISGTLGAGASRSKRAARSGSDVHSSDSTLMARRGSTAYRARGTPRPFRRRLQRGTLPRRRAIDYAVLFAHGLAAAHDRGIASFAFSRDGRSYAVNYQQITSESFLVGGVQ